MDDLPVDIFSAETEFKVREDISEMIKWTKILSIFGFVFLVLMVVLGVFTGFAISNLSSYGSLGNLPEGTGIAVMLFFIIIACLLFYPNLALYKYSVAMRQSLNSNDKALYSKAIKHLKNMFKYTGLVVIITTALLVIDIAISFMR